MPGKRFRKTTGTILLLAAFCLWGRNQAEATVTLTGATGGTSISADTAANSPAPAWTTLGPITITEGANADFGTGTGRTLILKAPAGFTFNTAVTPSISYTASRNITSASISVTDSNTLTATISVSGTTRADSLVIGNTTGIQVRPTAGTPLAAGRHIYRPATGGGTAVISGITTSADGSTGSNFGNLNEVAGGVTQLAFTTQPGNAVAGAPFGTQPVVRSQDLFGNNSTNGLPAINFVAVSLTSGTGPLQGANQVDLGLTAGPGIATLSGLRTDAAGTDKQLTVTSTNGLTSALSTVFTVSAGAPSSVSILTQPSATATAGVVFSQQPVVQVADAFGNPCNTSVAAARASGTGTLQGTVTINAVNGVATYTDLSHPLIGAITISFTSGSASATSTPVVVSPGPFTKLQVLLPGETAAPGTASGKTGTPTVQTAGTALAAVTVNAVDAGWNIVNTVNDLVHLTSTDANAGVPPDAALAGGTTTFNGVTFATAATQTLTATDVGDATKTGASSSVAVNPGAFSRIQLLMPGETAAPGTLSGETGTPTPQTAGTVFSVRVNGVDANWNITTGASGSGFTIQLSSSDANASLPAAADLASGTQTFNVTLRTAGSATITATDLDSPGLTSTSPAITVAKGNQTITFGSLTNRPYGTPPFQVTATASSGLPVTFAIVSGPATISGSTVTLTGIGTVTVRASQGGDVSYNAAPTVDQSFTVSAAILTVRADDKTRPFGQTNPPLTATITGFVNGDTSSILTGTPNLNTTAGVFSPEGAYTVTVARGSLATTNANYAFGFTNGVLTILPLANGMVAIHDSEYTRGLESIPATPPTPNIEGCTGFEWWPTNWQYSVLPEAMKEALRSDGTAFAVVSDASISAGTLLDSKGKPRYPILISLAAEAIADSEVDPLRSYVEAGGFLVVGSSSFTRRPDGGPRMDFALADEMGIHSAPADYANLENWVWNSSFTKVGNHPLLSHLPNGQLRWTAPASADEIPWGLSPGHIGPNNHLVWNVLTNGATVIAQGDRSPYMLVNSYGRGWFIYHAAMQPLVGHGGYNSGMYSYAFFRKAIEWAFASAHLPIPKLSPWPYAYDAAAVFRHDMESFTNFINAIEGSAQYENSVGVQGDYYFCTGAMRDYYNTTDRAVALASLRRAISLYGATIGSHNGGLSNFYNTTLTTNSYDFYHWGPDEVLDFDPPPGFASARAYAMASLSNSFTDLQGWGLTNASGLRFYASPYFNGSRDDSLGLLDQLKVATTGDEKLSPFPHFVRSTQSPYRRYPFVNLPVSDWYVGSQVAQSVENHTTDSIHGAIDFYYNLGALINLYSHSSSAGGASLVGAPSVGATVTSTPLVEQENVRYTLGKPRIWSANAEGVYNWWISRSNAQLNVVTMTNAGDQFTAVLGISGARDRSTAIEMLLPNTAFTGLQVRTNGVLTSNGYRLNGLTVKILVGTNVSTAQIQYTLPPLAQPDYYSTMQNVPLGVGAPGVLTNDITGASGGALTALLTTGPGHGTLLLSTNGSFSYTPATNFYGADGFAYQISDGVSTSATTTVEIQVGQAGVLFSDDFTRPAAPGLLAPWTNWTGNWTITGGVANVTSASGYAMVYTGVSSNDYWFEGQVNFSATGVYGGGLGGRFDPLTGHQYVAWVSPENSPLGPSATLRLLKFEDSTGFPFTALQQVTLTNEVGTNWHNLKLKFQGNQIRVFFDRSEVISLVDNGSFDGQPAYTNGGISLIQFGGPASFTMSVDNALAASLGSTPVLVATATNQSRLYGTTNPAFTGTLVGIQQGDNITATYTTAADQTSPAGTYAIVPAFSDPDRKLGNYLVTTNNGTLTVTQAVLTVTAGVTNKVYGQNLTFAGTEFVVSGLINSDTVSNVSLNSLGATPTASVSATPYPIVPSAASGIGLSNYSIVYVSGALTVTPAPLSCTAAGATRVYGTANPVCGGTLVGVLNGDNIAANFSTTAAANSPVGAYAIVPALEDPANRLTNYSPVLQNGTLTVTPAPLTITAVGVNKVYDATTTASVQLTDNRLAGDVLIAAYTIASFADKNVGPNKPVSVSGITISGPAAGNYTANTTTSTTANITALGLTGAVLVNDKPYDGTTSATIANRTLTGAISGDQVNLSGGTANFNDKNIGTAKPVTVSGLSLSGSDSSNYTGSTTANTSANITALALTVSAQGVDRAYDGTTNATVTLQDNRLAGDSLNVTYLSASFSDKNVGASKAVSVIGIAISGADAGNYSCNTTTATAADITARSLTVTAAGINKVYDGTSAATVTLADNRLLGDTLTANYTTASFTDKIGGTSKLLSVSGISLSGADAGNYTCNPTANTTANIAVLTVTGVITANNKAYDGTGAATIASRQLAGVMAGDSVTYVGGTATFADKNAAVGKTVTATGLSLSGADAGNYTCNSTAVTTADISGLPLSVTATALNKVYDGTANANVTLSDNRLAGDSFTIDYTSAAFASKNASLTKFVTVAGIKLSGPDAGNYAPNTTAGATGDITPLALTITAQGVNKVYDGTPTASVVLTDNRIAGDNLGLGYSAATYADKRVASGKLITVTGLTLAGPDALNYTFNTTAAASASITARPLTVTATGSNKVYDATPSVSVGLSDDRLAGDVLTTSYTSASFVNKYVGTSKPITIVGIGINGADAANYSVNSTAGASANITPAALTITAQGVDKAYDGATAATVILADNRLAGDDITPTYATATFLDKSVGTGKFVSISGIGLSGPDAVNYTFNTTAFVPASITPRALLVSAQATNKVYDGTSTTTVALTDNRVAGDTLTASFTTATFADKNVGENKVVTVSGISIAGADASNYSPNTTATTTADISARSLTVSAQGVNKVYDGTTTATVTLSDNRLAGDTLTASYATADFGDKLVGTAKNVSVNGITVSGVDAANYSPNTTTSTSANVTVRNLNVSALGINKVYDNTTTAAVTLSDNRVQGDILTDNYVAASFADKNVGVAKAVTVSGISTSGTDAANYLPNTAAGTSANITPATLTVTADAKTKNYGSSNPPLTTSITGYVEANSASAVSGQANLTTTATDASPAGTYAINVGTGTLSAPNYIFNFVPGVLTILPPPNTAPVLPDQANRSLADLTALTVLNPAVDSDIPADTLTYQLVAPPAGMQISPDGIITWTPTLAQSPSTNIVTTIVTDNGTPPLSATNTFTVFVSSPYDRIDLTDAAQAQADADGDGLSNLMEYGLGTDPRNPTDARVGLLSGFVSAAGNRYASIQFKRRRLNGGISIQYVPEVSGDRQTWFSDSSHLLEISVSALDAQFDWVTVRDVTPSSSSAPRYTRLRVIEN